MRALRDTFLVIAALVAWGQGRLCAGLASPTHDLGEFDTPDDDEWALVESGRGFMSENAAPEEEEGEESEDASSETRMREALATSLQDGFRSFTTMAVGAVETLSALSHAAKESILEGVSSLTGEKRDPLGQEEGPARGYSRKPFLHGNEDEDKDKDEGGVWGGGSPLPGVLRKDERFVALSTPLGRVDVFGKIVEAGEEFVSALKDTGDHAKSRVMRALSSVERVFKRATRVSRDEARGVSPDREADQAPEVDSMVVLLAVIASLENAQSEISEKFALLLHSLPRFQQSDWLTHCESLKRLTDEQLNTIAHRHRDVLPLANIPLDAFPTLFREGLSWLDSNGGGERKRLSQ